MKRSATPLPWGSRTKEGRRLDTEAFDLVLEFAGHVVGAMIVTQLQSARYAGCDGSEAPMDPLAYWLQRLEAAG
jgi:hypothetical protein